jgi:hypothetical protein
VGTVFTKFGFNPLSSFGNEARECTDGRTDRESDTPPTKCVFYILCTKTVPLRTCVASATRN